jgi:hypothetical protein
MTAPSSEPISEAAPTVIGPPIGWQLINFAELWQFRDFLYFLAWRDVKIRYKQPIVTPRHRRQHRTAPCQLADAVDESCVLDCIVESLPLAPGDYWMKLGFAAVREEIDEIERALRFTVTEGELFGSGRGHHAGLCAPLQQG